MKKTRYLIPLLGVIGFICLFLLVNEASSSGCRKCSSHYPYLTLLGMGYFSAITTIAIVFPSFPNRLLARGGFIGALLLGLTLSYISFPRWCSLCLIGHVCNILIWGIWLVTKPIKKSCLKRRLRWSILILTPLFTMAFFGYVVPLRSHLITSQEVESQALGFNSSYKKVILNFVTSNCSYCEEQLQALCQILSEQSSDYHLINVCSSITPDYLQYSPGSEWVEDRDGDLQKRFKVTGYPTLFVMSDDGKIAHVIKGLPDHLESELMSILFE